MEATTIKVSFENSVMTVSFNDSISICLNLDKTSKQIGHLKEFLKPILEAHDMELNEEAFDLTQSTLAFINLCYSQSAIKFELKMLDGKVFMKYDGEVSLDMLLIAEEIKKHLNK